MSIEQMFLILLGITNTMGAILIKGWMKRVEDTEKRLADFQSEVPKVYVTKKDMEKDIDRILNRFDKLEVKLDKLIDTRKE
ncbi:hypothetical protein D3C87_1218920 [compost metagenome]